MCPTCGRSALHLEFHKCPPWFEVWHEEHGYSLEVYADDVFSAAEAWAKECDTYEEMSGDRIAEGQAPFEVLVKDASGTIRRLEVTGWIDYVYEASEIVETVSE